MLLYFVDYNQCLDDIKIMQRLRSCLSYYSMYDRVPLPGLTATENMSDKKKAPKNIFLSTTKWTQELVDSIDVIVGDVKSTTNTFTLRNNPDARHWKADISFRHGDNASSILKEGNAPIPWNRGNTYGTDYIYVNLPIIIGRKVQAAVQAKGFKCKTEDDRLISDGDDWWKSVNTAAERNGVVKADASFEQRDIGSIFKVTKTGIVVNLDYIISVKLTKLKSELGDAAEKLDNKDVFRLAIDASRVGLKQIKFDAPGPPLVPRIPTQRAAKDDIASDDLLEELSMLGV